MKGCLSLKRHRAVARLNSLLNSRSTAFFLDNLRYAQPIGVVWKRRQFFCGAKRRRFFCGVGVGRKCPRWPTLIPASAADHLRRLCGAGRLRFGANGSMVVVLLDARAQAQEVAFEPPRLHFVDVGVAPLATQRPRIQLGRLYHSLPPRQPIAE